MISLKRIQTIAKPERIEILAYLKEHEGAIAEKISQELDYPRSTIYKYLKELEQVNLIDSKEENGVKHYYLMDFEILISTDSLSALLGERISYSELFRETYGEKKFNKILELAKKASGGKITLRQAAGEADLSYYEFMMLYDDWGFLDEDR